MSQKRHGVDQIIAKLRRADIELGKGSKVPDAEPSELQQWWIEFFTEYGLQNEDEQKDVRSSEKSKASPSAEFRTAA